MNTLFDGITFNPSLDTERLQGQLQRVYEAVRSGEWLTLEEIGQRAGVKSQASISARLRDLRKERFGNHKVERRRRGTPSLGVFEYRFVAKD